jgi:hypothetical protein
VRGRNSGDNLHVVGIQVADVHAYRALHTIGSRGVYINVMRACAYT